MSNPTTHTVSLKSAALVAGLSLLLMAILAPIANFGILLKLYVPGDAATTFHNFTTSSGSVRWAVLLFLIVAILDIIVAWALYLVFKSVNQGISLLTGWIRVVYAAMLGTALFRLLNVLQLTGAGENLPGLAPQQLHTQTLLAFQSFQDGWSMSLIIFGIHLGLLGYLTVKSGLFPKWLGVLVVIAGLGYCIDSAGKMLSPTYDLNLAAYTFLGEVLLMGWLIWRGVKGFDRASG
ncbi:MAG: DUF4386 domain-containing protein [Lentisphaeria bacterium]|nr:DUF4386 domain-containing protein [Candidatus Neomarinimicrobiota bacterium]MCF7841923.1 DUF4386 domain-containing protein [Lentisphaeria bacterium]